jgi:hypothetical protein
VSWQATSWALETDLDPTSKIILLAYADFAGESGTSAWMFKKTLLTRVRKVSESTIGRRMALLLEDGYLREGDQDAVPDYVRALPPESRPIVYDMAMNEETRLGWKDTYEPGPRRSAAAAAGAAGGRKSAALRQRGEADNQPGEGTAPWGLQADTPPVPSEEPQVTGGVTVAPPSLVPDGGSSLQPPGLHSYDTPGVAQLCNPISTHEEPTNALFRLEAPSEPQDGPSETARPARGARPARSRRRVERTEEEQQRWEAADKIARWWWGRWQNQGVAIIGDKFPGFRKSIVLAALEAGAAPTAVQDALRACNEVFPNVAKFQAALAAAATGESPGPWRGRGQPSNLIRQPAMDPAEQARVTGMFSGVSVAGRRIGNG